MEHNKEYFAFISYKREDEKWAKWLQHKLEHYHLPVNVRKENPSLPQSIRPVFKDTSELAAGVLAEEIHEALDNSKYLIVICSPRAAQSKWVGKEVQTFIDMGRSDKIIPFIIAGTPFSDNLEEECFPSALLNLPKDQELLGVNINEMGREAAVIKVVARMFGLKFDTLWQRYEREKKRQRWTIVGGALLFALMSLGIGGYIAHQNQELDARNKEVAAERDRANSERDRANSERDRAESANASLLLANDSIKKAYLKLNLSEKQLRESNYQLSVSNQELREEQARMVAQEAVSLSENGNSLLATRLLLNTISQNSTYSLPYIEELETSMRIVNYNLQHTNGSICILQAEGNYPFQNAIYSPDGKYIVTASNDNTIGVWLASSGKRIGTLSGHQDIVNALTFNKSGNLLLSSSYDGSCILWKFDSRNIIRHFIGHKDAVQSAEFSNDEKNILTGSWDGSAKIWDIKTGKVLFSYQTGSKSSEFHNAYYTDNSNSFIVSTSNEVKRFDTKTKTVIQAEDLKNFEDNIIYSKNGHYKAELKSVSFLEQELTIYESKTKRLIFQKNKLNSIGTSISFTKDNKYLAIFYNDHYSKKKSCLVEIVDLKSKSIIRTIKEDNCCISTLDLSPDNRRIVAVGSDNTVKMYNLHERKIIQEEDFGSYFYNAFIDKSGKYLLAKKSHSIQIFDAKEQKKIYEVTFDSIRTDDYSYTISNNCKYLAFYTKNNHLIVHNIENGGILWDKPFLDINPLITPEFTDSLGRLHLACYKNRSITYTPDDKYILLSSSSLFKIDALTGEVVDSLDKECVYSECRPYSNEILVITRNYNGMDSELSIYDLKSLEEKRKIKLYCEVDYATFSRNGDKIHVYVNNKSIVYIYDAKTLKFLRGIKGDANEYISRGSLSPCGQYIITHSPHTFQVCVYSTESFKKLFVLVPHTRYVWGCGFSNDSKCFYTYSQDGSLQIHPFLPFTQLLDQQKQELKNWPFEKDEYNRIRDKNYW